MVSVLARQNPLDRMISKKKKKKVQSAILDQLWSQRDIGDVNGGSTSQETTRYAPDILIGL